MSSEKRSRCRFGFIAIFIIFHLTPSPIFSADVCHDVIPEYGVRASCAVPQYEGVNPSEEEIISIFEQTGSNQLGNSGPPLPQIWLGCSEEIRSNYHPSCPPAKKISPVVPPYLLGIMR
jgi:hypothetical protein